MNENPYQSPGLNSFAQDGRQLPVPIRPRPTFVRVIAGMFLLVLAVLSSMALSVIGGLGAFFTSFVAWLTIGLCNASWQRSDRYLYGVIAGGATIIIAFGFAFMVPGPITVACLFFGVSLSLVRIWFRSVEERNLRGLRLMDQGKDELAIVEFNRVLQQNPKHYGALVNRSVAELKLGRLEQSKVDLDEAIRQRPDLQIAYALRGQLLFVREAWDEAIADLRVALEMVPEDPYSRMRLSQAYSGRKDLDQARVALEPLFHVESFRAAAHLSHGRILFEQQAHAAAIADYEVVAALNPNESEAWRVIGVLSAGSPDPNARNAERAITAATRACELSSWKDWNPVSILAAAYAEAGQFDLAIRWAKEALRLAPPEEQVTRELRITQYESGQPYRMPQEPAKP